MNYQKPRGTEDIYYEKAKELLTLEIILKTIAEQYNYSEIRLPIFEDKELFVRSIGQETDIIKKEMFELLDKKKRTFVLRPEGTAPVIRSVIENKLYGKYELPLKLFYIGNMFRYERPQHGRLRQFNQFGVEVIGVNNFLLDTEVILLAYNLLKTVGLKNINLKLNCLTTNENLQKYINYLQKYLEDEDLCNVCKNKQKNNPLRILDCKIDNIKFDNIPKIYDYLTKKENEYFNNIQKILKKLDLNFILDHKLVRGLDYYTSLVFEITLIDQENRELTLLGGGRYDKLVSELENNLNLPAIGFAMGLERILISLNNNNVKLSPLNKLDAYIVCLSENSRYFATSLLLMLRSAGYKVDCDYLNRSVKSQFKSVERLNAKNTIIIGDKELKNKIVKIKNQKIRKEQNIKFEKILNFLEKERNKYEENT